MGLQTDKKYQLADWRVRPLPEELLVYARMDTHYLLYIYDCLKVNTYQVCMSVDTVCWLIVSLDVLGFTVSYLVLQNRLYSYKCCMFYKDKHMVLMFA